MRPALKRMLEIWTDSVKFNTCFVLQRFHYIKLNMLQSKLLKLNKLDVF